MSQRESITRCIIIIKCLRRGPASYREIEKKLKDESAIRGYNFVTSKRTFQRDVIDIRESFGISIVYSFQEGLYRIENNMHPEIADRLIESFETYSLLGIYDDLMKYLQFESSGAEGSDMIPLILKAVRSRKKLAFSYTKYHEGKTSSRTTEPLGVKEFRKRFYLVANDLRDSVIKTFALDRISDPEILEKGFRYPESFSIEKYFSDCFGIIRPDDDEPEEVFLTFDAVQGRYIKDLPVHSSQVIISETKKEIRVRLRLYITHDFIMELLSYGDTVKVLAPDSLATEIRKTVKNTLRQYKQ